MKRLLTLLLLLIAATASAQVTVVPAPGVDGSGLAKANVTVKSGNVLQIQMPTPAVPTGVASQIAGSDLAAGNYKIAIVGVDPAGGVSAASPVLTTTVAAGGLGKVVVSYVAPTGWASVRVYTSLAGGTVPDRYFTSTSGTTYSLTTVTGATVAALPAAASAYRVSFGGTTNWVSTPLLLADGTAAAPSLGFANYQSSGIFTTAGSVSISIGGSLTARFGGAGNSFSYIPLALLGSSTTSAFTLAQTWNTTGLIDGGVRFQFTDTASGAGSLPFAIYGGAAGTTSLFSVGKTGTSTGVAFIYGYGNVNLGGYYGWITGPNITAAADGAISLRNAAVTGFTALNLGPTTGNTERGSSSLTNGLVTINMDGSASDYLSGTGTGTVTSKTTALPVGVYIGLTCKVTTILGGVGLTTVNIGDGTDADRFCAACAIAAGTTVNVANWTADPVWTYKAATSIVVTAVAGVLSTGVLSCTPHSFTFTPIGS
jgi:hypothetical protein